MCMGALILGNLVLIMVETDEDAKCYPDHADDFNSCPHRSDGILWIQVTNMVVLLCYTLECLVRFYVERSLFWFNKWNLIDFVIVVFGWLDYALADTLSINLLRMSRLIRVARAVRLLISIPESRPYLDTVFSCCRFHLYLSISIFLIYIYIQYTYLLIFPSLHKHFQQQLRSSTCSSMASTPRSRRGFPKFRGPILGSFKGSCGAPLKGSWG